MKTFAPFLAGVLLAAPAAHSGDPEQGECHHPPAPARAEAKDSQGWLLVRGEKLKGAPAVTLEHLVQKPEAHAGKTVFVEGKVRRACTKKGCWMELARSERGAGVRVTFKDYGFFVPLDSAGSTARVEGVVKVAELSDERAKHYESEGAIVPRGKDGKPREVQLVASGVELRR
ncbi:MAG TPA: DUF4920 domain-containing protein [Myxococcaceae bacterium]|nr:DUF4920 domain-containing protein [Myxococcaceae bacterium]